MAYRQPNNGYPRDDTDLDRDRSDRNNDGHNNNTHLIEHLATFTVTRETGIIYPADGMRRLLQLEKSNGIWSQKMHLCLDNNWALIMDYETGAEIERFPSTYIQEPTAFTSQDPMEMYNNILVFIVNNANGSRPPEMHIFQCQSISAEDLVEDLKQLRLGKTLTRNHKSVVPPPNYKPLQNVINPTRDHHSRDYLGSDSELTANNDDSSSTTSEKYEKDVTILNHCFDDIEKFIARLQHAAAAARELERRRKSRRSVKRDMGDGMLTMRTKPPPEKEFLDIFQKFKLSFNLLAKLKAHIHDPNAPELVHFLFTPLALIVEASHDTYFDQHIPHNVISPLLTREAVNLLTHCVTSKETELWHSLGSPWLIPRDQYNGHVPPYHPTFMDGWSPEYPIMDESESALENKGFKDSREGPFGSDYQDYQSSSQDNNLMFDNRNIDHSQDKELPQNLGDSTRSDISVDSIETKRLDDRGGYGRNQDNFLDDLHARGANIVQVTYPRTANNDKELTVVRGEFLEILDNSRKWWKARNSRGQIAHVPHTIVSPHHGGNNIVNNPLYSQQHLNSSHNTDLSMERSSGAHSSNVPDHVQNIPTKKSADWIRKERLDTSKVPLPPPLPTGLSVPSPPPFPPTEPEIQLVQKRLETEKSEIRPPLVRSQSRQSIMSLHEELTTVFTLTRNREKQKPKIDIKQTPEVYINKLSNPTEVQTWLTEKGFDSKICEKFRGASGDLLLDTEKSELIKMCGDDEGKRLYSQLNIQRSISGYQTIRTTELQAILAKARQKIET